MPESEMPDEAGATERPSPTEVVARLERAVDRLLAEHAVLKASATETMRSHRELLASLEEAGPDGDAGGDVPERLQNLAEENRKLRETLDRARKSAERIRSRLFMVEDEL